MRRLIVVVSLLLVTGVVLPARAGDREDCIWPEPITTLLKTEPTRVVAACRRLADQGDGLAQNNLGSLYYNGQSGQQDYAEAAKWYRKAADMGNADAQTNLGVLYTKGDGVPKDHIAAYMWFNLAAAQGDASGAQGCDFLATQMRPAQIERAKTLAAAWKPTTGE